MKRARTPRMSVEEYLALERNAEVKHEYVDGLVLAMAGAEPEHNEVRSALEAALRQRFQGHACRTFSADQRVRVKETGMYVYPDIAVVCGPPQFDDGTPRSLLNPQVVIEVLSEATESYDRGEKFRRYRRRPSIEEYVLVASEARRIEHYRRVGQGPWRWELSEIEGDAVLELPSLGVSVPLTEIYAGLDGLQRPADDDS